MLDRSRHGIARDAFGPIAIREKSVDDVKIETGGVTADYKLATALLNVGCHVNILNASCRGCAYTRPHLRLPTLEAKYEPEGCDPRSAACAFHSCRSEGTDNSSFAD